MSHITKVHLKIKDLSCVAAACTRLGLTFMEGQRTFRKHGANGTCEHAINAGPNAYEVGLRAVDDGYELQFDYWNGGYGLMEKIGTRDGRGPISNANRFSQAYAAEVAIKSLRRSGHRVRESVGANGSIVVEAVVSA